jgi:hypothetical protein
MFNKPIEKDSPLRNADRKSLLKKKDGPSHDTMISFNTASHKVGSNSSTNRLTQLHFTREASDVNINVSPSKMIDEQRKKAFLHKKA